MISKLFSNTMTLLEKSLDLRGMRHEVLVSNISNQDTPGYIAKDLKFEEALGSAIVGQGAPLAKTDPRHFISGGHGTPDGTGLILMRDNPKGYDHNSVDVEQEMAQMAENSLMYNTSAQLISKKFQGLLFAIREGR